MGRLFWKILAGTWLTLLLVGSGIGLAVYLHGQTRLAEAEALATGPRAEWAVQAVAAALRREGLHEVEELFEDWPGRQIPVLVVDGNGREVFGRSLPPEALRHVWARLRHEGPSRRVRQVRARDGEHYLVFVPPRRPSPPEPLPLWLRLGLLGLASLLFSAGLAVYLSRPVRHLRRASHRLADGDLSARAMPDIGARRDEIADLGRDFDHMAEQLEQLVGAQRRLLHDVSHELRSPLARLQVAIGLARQRPGALAQSLERVERESRRLDALVGEVLTLSRLEGGAVQPEEGLFDLSGLLQDVAEDARFEAEASGRSLQLVLPAEGEDALVEGDAGLMRRAFDNLLRNAVHHTPQGSTIAVSLDQAAAQWRVRVDDDGPGVSSADLARLFEPFQRLSGAGGEGFGLGLAIARRAIEAHRGRIHAENRPAGGLRVEVVLPCAHDDSRPSPADR